MSSNKQLKEILKQDGRTKVNNKVNGIQTQKKNYEYSILKGFNKFQKKYTNFYIFRSLFINQSYLFYQQFQYISFQFLYLIILIIILINQQQMNDRRAWQQQEDKAIIDLVKKYGQKKWAVIAHKMGQIYGLKGRSGKQCRERWHNHLDASINKNPWTQEQEKIIFQSHRKYGNKWTEIAKHLEGRTDNSIKNHFYSTLRRSLRRINKLLGSKNSTTQMRDIKPSVLSKIFAYAEKDVNDLVQEESRQMFYDCKGLSEALLQFSSYKSSKQRNKSSILLSEEDRLKFETIINKIIKFNQTYEQQKQQKIRIKKILFYNDKTESELSESAQRDSIQEQNKNIMATATHQSESEFDEKSTKKRVRKAKKIFEIPIKQKTPVKKIKKQQNEQKEKSIKQEDKQINQLQANEQNNYFLRIQQQENPREFQKYLNAIKQVQNYKIHQQQRERLELPQIIIYADDVLCKKYSKDYQIQLNFALDNNDFNIYTPRMQNIYSPKLPTPTNCFKSNEYGKAVNPTQEQIEKKLNEIKNQIYQNSKRRDEQSTNLRPQIFVPSPKSAFKRY